MIEHVTAAAPRMILRLYALRRLIDAAYPGSNRPSRVCEIGAGLGDAASYMHARLRPDALDLYEASEVARTELVRRFEDCPGVKVHAEFDSHSLGYGLITSFEVLEHVEDDLGLLESIRDALDPGGKLIGSVPAFMSKWQAVDDYAGHVRRYEPAELADKLARVGLRDVRVTLYGAPLTNLLYLPRQLHYGPRAAGRSAEAMRAATIDSGTSRDLVRRFDPRLVVPVVRAFASLQSLPGLNRLGDGLMFEARRRDG